MFLTTSQNNGIEVKSMKNKNLENRNATFPQTKNSGNKLSHKERKVLRLFADFMAEMILKDQEEQEPNDGNLEEDK